MPDSKEENITLRVVISSQAEQSLFLEMKRRKCDNYSELIEKLAADLERGRK